MEPDLYVGFLRRVALTRDPFTLDDQFERLLIHFLEYRGYIVVLYTRYKCDIPYLWRVRALLPAKHLRLPLERLQSQGVQSQRSKIGSPICLIVLEGLTIVDRNSWPSNGARPIVFFDGCVCRALFFPSAWIHKVYLLMVHWPRVFLGGQPRVFLQTDGASERT